MKPRRPRKPHCTHCSHMAKCSCLHPRYLHAGELEDEQCLERSCKCEEFHALPGYTQAQLTHDTVPIEGYPDSDGATALQRRDESRKEIIYKGQKAVGVVYGRNTN